MAPPVINGWVGTTAAPARLYAWTFGDKRRWMHKVPGHGSDSVAITIGPLQEQAREPAAHGIMGADTDFDAPYTEVPEPVADSRFRSWIMDIDGSLVAVVVKSYADTASEPVAEAEAIVQSLYVEQEPRGTDVGRRVVVTLPAGWDSG